MNYSSFYDDVLLDCARCPLPVVLAQVRLSVIELCDRSRIWQYTTDDEVVVANQTDYDLALPDGTEVVEVLGGYFNECEIFHKSADWLDSNYGRWQALIGQPRFMTQTKPSAVTVVPYPDVVQSTDRLRWRLALRPSRTSTSFDPDGIFCNDFYQDIVHAVKARLMLSPGKPYTNPKLAEYHLKRWLAGVNRARLQANKSRGREATHVQFPRYI